MRADSGSASPKDSSGSKITDTVQYSTVDHTEATSARAPVTLHSHGPRRRRQPGAAAGGRAGSTEAGTLPVSQPASIIAGSRK